MKRLVTFILSLLLAISMALPAFAEAEDRRLYDFAGLLSEEDNAAVEQELAQVSEKIGMDVIVLTSANKGGKTLREYADDFYDEGGFGTGKERSGIVILIDMEDRTVYMSTCGKAIDYYNDDRIYAITDGDDQLYDYLAAGNYRKAVERIAANAVYYYERGVDPRQYTYDEETGQIRRYKKITVFEMIVSLLIAIVPAWLYTRSIKNQYEMKSEKRQAEAFKLAYRVAAAFAFAVATDDLIDHHVTRTRIVSDMNGSGGSPTGHAGRSTIHMSGGGTFHGGGGGGRHF